MGLIDAAKNAVQNVFADTWREYFYCDRMEDDVLMTKGQKKVSGKSSNTKGTDNIISNGSIVAVNEGQCMIIVDQGGIAEVCAEAGEFIYDSSSEPSIFYGGLGESLKKSWETFFRRLSMGGDVGKDQRVYYINIREIFDNKFGTQQPIPYRFVPDEVTGRKMTFHIRCNGEFSFRIKDPVIFYKNVANNVSDDYEKSQIFSFLRSSMVTALNPALNALARQGFHYADLTGSNFEIANEIKEVLQEEWLEKRGIEFSTINVQSMTLPPEEEEELSTMEKERWRVDDPRLHAREVEMGMVEAMKAAGSNANGAMNGFMGMGMINHTMGQMGMNPSGMMGSMQQAQQFVAQQNQQNQQSQPVQQAQQRQPVPAADSWTCACGTVCTGKFCVECGTPKPMEGVWTCTCGAVNKGKFCSECGAKKPAGVPLYRCDKCGWEPEDPKNPPKFCPECGDPFTDSDIQ